MIGSYAIVLVVVVSRMKNNDVIGSFRIQNVLDFYNDVVLLLIKVCICVAMYQVSDLGFLRTHVFIIQSLMLYMTEHW